MIKIQVGTFEIKDYIRSLDENGSFILPDSFPDVSLLSIVRDSVVLLPTIDYNANISGVPGMSPTAYEVLITLDQPAQIGQFFIVQIPIFYDGDQKIWSEVYVTYDRDNQIYDQARISAQNTQT